jgi:hypothetical protein
MVEGPSGRRKAHVPSDVDFTTVVFTSPVLDSFSVDNVTFASAGVEGGTTLSFSLCTIGMRHGMHCFSPHWLFFCV